MDHPIWEGSNFQKLLGFHRYFAFYGLAWPDIQILTPDLDSPENFMSGDIWVILFMRGQIFKNCQVFAIYCLAWPDIQILTSDLDSPENFASDDIWIILFGRGQIFKNRRDFSGFSLFWPSLMWYSNSDTRSGFSWKFHIWWYIDHPIW